MKMFLRIILIQVVVFGAAIADTYFALSHYPYSPSAGETGSTAIHQFSSSIVAWADGYENLQLGADANDYRDPSLALGAAVGTSFDVVCLGRGGVITLTFSGRIRDGAGVDFAVFENAFDPSYLELAHVEVSSDGTNFVRFPNYSLNTGSAVDPTKVYGLAGKFVQAYGTPFDLNELQVAYNAVIAGDANHDFSATFKQQLTNGFPLLDLQNISHVRIVDVIGDGSSSRDCRGWQIYDPYPSGFTAGFDLDAVGVINQPAPAGLPQAITFDSIPHQKLSFGCVELGAVADSGLPVQYFIQSGNATLNANVLTFSSTGLVEVVASQSGDATYAPASPVLHSFIVADKIQHLFFEQVPNQIRGGADVQLRAYSSSGLPVEVQATDAPVNVVVDRNLVMGIGNDAGLVTLRAAQAGNASVAPAEEVLVHFEIVEPGAENAPVSLSSWMVSNTVPQPAISVAKDVYGRSAIQLEYALDRRVSAGCRITESSDLMTWSNAVPEIISQTVSNDLVLVSVQLLAEKTNSFQRLEIQEQ